MKINYTLIQGVHHSSLQGETRGQTCLLGKRTEAEGTPSTLPQPTTTKQTITTSRIATPQQHYTHQIHPSSHPHRSAHKHGQGIACSTSHDDPSHVLLPKSRHTISPKYNQTKTTALVKPSPR